MDAFAARQLEKRKEKAKLEEEKKKLAEKGNERNLIEELKQINKLFGIPEPPISCSAIGKNHSAAVWWPPIKDNYMPTVKKKEESEEERIERERRVEQAKRMEKLGIKPKVSDNQEEEEEEELEEENEVDPRTYDVYGFEVHRYRKDHGQWHYKGFNSVKFEEVGTGVFDEETGKEVTRYIERTYALIEDLANDTEYKFTIKGVNKKGASIESEPSNPVFVEADLPPGWFRFYDETRERYYYANLKLRVSKWARPETDRFFLDEAILDNFEEREIKFLHSMYYEEMEHFKAVTVDRFMDVLLEIGERASKKSIIALFRGYAKCGEANKLLTWSNFMEVCNHIKRRRIKADEVFSADKLITTINQIASSRLLNPSRNKLGDWTVQYSKLAERDFYKNKKTGESCWSMPLQVKFYIPKKLEDKLLRIFTYGQIDEFKSQFSLLDLDGSGDLSDKEIWLLLEALEINCSEKLFKRLIKTIDLNGNGTIEFDEFCYMMYQLQRKDKGSEFWDQVKNKKHAGSHSKLPKARAVARNDDDSTIITTVGPHYRNQPECLFAPSAPGDKLSQPWNTSPAGDPSSNKSSGSAPGTAGSQSSKTDSMQWSAPDTAQSNRYGTSPRESADAGAGPGTASNRVSKEGEPIESEPGYQPLLSNPPTADSWSKNFKFDNISIAVDKLGAQANQRYLQEQHDLLYAPVKDETEATQPYCLWRWCSCCCCCRCCGAKVKTQAVLPSAMGPVPNLGRIDPSVSSSEYVSGNQKTRSMEEGGAMSVITSGTADQLGSHKGSLYTYSGGCIEGGCDTGEVLTVDEMGEEFDEKESEVQSRLASFRISVKSMKSASAPRTPKSGRSRTPSFDSEVTSEFDEEEEERRRQEEEEELLRRKRPHAKYCFCGCRAR